MPTHYPILAGFFMWCVAATVVQSEAYAASGEDMVFAWKPPLTFQVEETASKKGESFKLLHTLSFVETNKQFLLKWQDVKILSVNGQAVGPAMEKELTPVRAMVLANPPMIINTQGEFAGTSHSQESVEEINRLLDKAFPNRPEDARRFFTAAAKAPEGRALLDSAMANRYWNPWVGAWIGLKIGPGERITNEVSLSIGSSEFPATRVITRSEAPNTNEICLHFEQIAKGPELSKAIVGMVDGLSKLADKESHEPFPNVKETSIRITMDVITNPHNLLPSSSKRVIHTKSVGDADTVITRESYEYKFLWNKE